MAATPREGHVAPPARARPRRAKVIARRPSASSATDVSGVERDRPVDAHQQQLARRRACSVWTRAQAAASRSRRELGPGHPAAGARCAAAVALAAGAHGVGAGAADGLAPVPCPARRQRGRPRARCQRCPAPRRDGGGRRRRSSSSAGGRGEILRGRSGAPWRTGAAATRTVVAGRRAGARASGRSGARRRARAAVTDASTGWAVLDAPRRATSRRISSTGERAARRRLSDAPPGRRSPPRASRTRSSGSSTSIRSDTATRVAATCSSSWESAGSVTRRGCPVSLVWSRKVLEPWPLRVPGRPDRRPSRDGPTKAIGQTVDRLVEQGRRRRPPGGSAAARAPPSACAGPPRCAGSGRARRRRARAGGGWASPGR